jgi:predicted component of type VI protein secretion system
MVQLVPLDGPLRGRPFPLAAGQRVGRHSRCEVSLDDVSISRLHARVVRRGPALWLVDEGSRNGLWAAGQRVGEVELRAGLELAIGRLEVRVEAGAEAEPPAERVLDEDLDFAVDPDRDLGSTHVRELGFELEDPAAIDLEAPPAAPRATAAGSPLPSRSPSRSAADPAAPTVSRPSGGPPPAQPAVLGPAAAAAEVRRAALLREVARPPSGLLRGDLTQFPGWVQGLVWVALLGLFGLLAYGMFQWVQGAKG